MPNVQNVTTGKPMVGGAVYVAPLGTTLPTTTSEELDSAFKDLGYMSDAGVTNDISRETSDVKAWGGDTVMKIQTGKTDNWTFTMIEALNIDVLKQVYGEDNVTESNGTITIKANAKELEAHVWVFDMVLTDGSAKRVVIPIGKIATVGEVSYTDSAAVGFAATLCALPYGTNNDTHFEYVTEA